MTKQCCEQGETLSRANKRPVIAVIGNPNCGKSTLFNLLTGIKQKTGNWPGVTVERREGITKHQSKEYTIVDLPGVYSLDSDREALDEQVARQYILSGDADALIIVADASNIERSLFLTLQLLETGIPAVLALNMVDVATTRGMKIDPQQLSEQLKCPVVPIIAKKNEGTQALLNALVGLQPRENTDNFSLPYPEEIIEAVSAIEKTLSSTDHSRFIRHWHAIQCLEGYFSTSTTEKTQEIAELARQQVRAKTNEDADTLIAATRFEYAHQVSEHVVNITEQKSENWSDKIDHVVLNDYLGLPIFFLAIYLMFSITINFGGALIDFFDITAGAIFIDGFRVLLEYAQMPSWLQFVLTDGIGGGIQVVATFIPIIATLYFCLSILEDSGYMARAAFVMDRFMRRLGLPGKAFVPLIVGFGCNVPSIMATRSLEKSRDRILTVMMAPFMSCGARLSVYALFAAAFFTDSGHNIVFLLYILGIMAAIFTALLLKSSVLKGESDAFLIELPAYNAPSIKSLVVHTWGRLKNFIFEAGKFIVVMVMVINILNAIGPDGSFDNENSSQSILSITSQTFTPAFEPMGIEEENWPAIVGIFSGLLAKEVVVGTLDAVYSNIEGIQNDDEGDFSFSASLAEAVETTQDNLADVLYNIGDPLGFRVLDSTDDLEAAADEQEVSNTLFGSLVKYFNGQVGAFSYLLFILLYTPCVAALAAIKRETGTRWAIFSVIWSFYLAYGCATIFYQTATFNQHPEQSALWILGLTLGFFAIWFTLKRNGPSLLDTKELTA